MPSSDDIHAQLDLLRVHRRMLSGLLIQQATHGLAYAPPAITAGILEAREAILRCKSILREWDVEVEDLPDDAELPQDRSTPSLRAEAGLEALADLMYLQEARAAVAVYQATFEEARHHFTLLSNYKKLHDLFQQLEDRHAILARAAKPLPANEQAWDDIELNEPELYVITEQLIEFAAEPSFITENAIWTNKLGRYQRDVRTALESYNVNNLKSALQRMKEILDRQISRTNTRLISAAEALRLETLVDALRTLRHHLQELPLNEAERQIHGFEAGVEGLAQLNQSLNHSVALHALFQEFDDELRRVEALCEYDIAELHDGWQDLEPLTALLCSKTSATWAIRLAALAAEVKQALETGESLRTRRAFSRYRSYATISFNHVDYDLRDLCNELQRVGTPLGQVLGLVAFAAHPTKRSAPTA